ncbi:MAG TPA: choice-of-anchor tandem repeat GloVer-containing protein [Chitinophagales bacterium]|nr:choice-of-anchor tandem repeat GloVer-containing protein [Chitinophagales bacterium]
MKHLLFPLSFIACIIITKGQSPQIWGTCSFGDLGYGAIIKSDSTCGNFHVVYSFDGTNGASPLGSLCSGGYGKLYGLTEEGGYNNNGVVFSYDTSTGIYHKFHDFASNPADSGEGAYSGMLLAMDGMLYGTTAFGGIFDKGEIYRVDPSIDSYSPIYHFYIMTTGANPECQLVQFTDGNLYGTTRNGGQNGSGIIFRFHPSDSSCDQLYDLTYNTGAYPAYGALLPNDDGKLYGLTVNGGTHGRGVIFSYDPFLDTYTDLHDFDPFNDDGGGPSGGLTKADDGLLYGMTGAGGINEMGVIFKYDVTTQQYTVVFNFSDSTGSAIYRSLLKGSNGKLFGTAKYSQMGGGTAFSFDPVNDAFVTLIDFSSIDCAEPLCDLIETGVDVTNAIALAGSSNHPQLIASPNPASSYINLVYSVEHNATLTITNPYGTTVKQLTLYPYFKNRIVYVDDFAAGIYLVTMREGIKVSSRKVVIAK